jgi:hypothetical protein
LDCVYRGYNLNYLTTLFDRYVPDGDDLRSGLVHAFRRVYSSWQHQYQVYFVLRGATGATIQPGHPEIRCLSCDEICQSLPESEQRSRFLDQLRHGPATILSLEWSKDPDAGAAVEGSRQEIQEIVDYLDFQSPNQRFELAPTALVYFAEAKGAQHTYLYPDPASQQPGWPDYVVDIEPEWVGQLKGLSEALRWSAVAWRERTPEVSLLAAWFGFEFLAGDVERSSVAGIMEFFPKALALGNLRRRLYYWWRCLQASPAFDHHERREALTERATLYGSPHFAGIIQLLNEVTLAQPTEDAKAVLEIVRTSVLLSERTTAEARLFTNNQLIAQTLQEESKQIRWDLQRFSAIRNKLVHRARIAHPLLTLVSERARRLLYDLLRDISAQLTSRRLRNSVAEVLHDYRDSFDELMVALGTGMPPDLVNRFLLS